MVRASPSLTTSAWLPQVETVELSNELHGFLTSHNPHTGIGPQNVHHCSAVVGLHVVDNQIVQLPAGQYMGHILHILYAHGPVHSIEQHGFIIQEQIGIIGHAAGYGEYVFKQRQPAVAAAHPKHLVRHFFYAIQIEISSFSGDSPPVVT